MNYQISFTTINHIARKELGISNGEYIFLDTVCNLSNDPRFNQWCVAKKTNLADMCNIYPESVSRLIKKFTIGKSKYNGKEKANPILLEQDEKTGNIRTNLRWYETVVINKNLIKNYKENRLKNNKKAKKNSQHQPQPVPGYQEEPIDDEDEGEWKYPQPPMKYDFFLETMINIDPLAKTNLNNVKERKAAQLLYDRLGCDVFYFYASNLSWVNEAFFLSKDKSYSFADLQKNIGKYEDEFKRCINGEGNFAKNEYLKTLFEDMCKSLSTRKARTQTYNFTNEYTQKYIQELKKNNIDYPTLYDEIVNETI